jgi:hypothetical protein
MKTEQTPASRRSVYVLASIALAGILSASTYAWAGAKAGASVSISANFGTAVADGTIGTVHNSASNTEFIGCYAAANNNDVAVSCSATDSYGSTFDCTSYSPNLVSVVNGINADSHVRIVADSKNNGTCTAITVWHYSTHYKK